ncbi:MAG TPA: YggS family pyridoxal phosphate-dependent enzyme [Gammaproteobacteria bacterium]|nr:YggS family pyridoxal phosphate-dependent enzyme [Gammaproteobacteria bacterium]
MNDIPSRIKKIKNQIREWEMRYQRKPGTVLLLAASKTQPVEKIREAVAAGQMAFGENYLQESLEKIISLADEKIEWHFIGSIQSNKTRKIAEHFAWVHTVSDIKIAKRLNEQRPMHLPPLNICLQVNSSLDAAKAGIDPKDIDSLAEYCSGLENIKLRGLMTIPIHKNTFDEQREELKKLRIVYEKLNERGFELDTLSMGMSEDMEAAIAEGSTLLRVGTAIFGKRK